MPKTFNRKSDGTIISRLKASVAGIHRRPIDGDIEGDAFLLHESKHAGKLHSRSCVPIKSKARTPRRGSLCTCRAYVIGGA